MRKQCWNKILVFWVLGTYLSCLPRTSSAEDISIDVKFRQLERDIPSLYLINGLFLSDEQIKDLLSLLQKVKVIEEKKGQQIEKQKKELDRDIEKCMDKIIRQISRTGELSKKSLKYMEEARTAQQRLQRLQREKEQALIPLIDKAYALLTPTQQDIVKSFVPCFIPNRDFRNPERVGQATGDTSVGEKMLSKLRQVPEDRLDEIKEHHLTRAVRYIMYKRHIRYSEEAEHQVREELKGRLEQIIPRVRAMSDVDFELQKSALSKELLPLEDKDKHSYSDKNAIRWKVKKYLLNTGNIEVLQARLQKK